MSLPAEGGRTAGQPGIAANHSVRDPHPITAWDLPGARFPKKAAIGPAPQPAHHLRHMAR